YEQRNAILDATDLSAQVASLREGCFTDLTRQFVPVESVEEQWNVEGLEKVLREEWALDLPLKAEVEAAEAMTDEDIVERVVKAADEAFAAKVELVGGESFTQFERMVLLQSIDSHWREHLSALDYLRQGIHLRGYAQKQPKQEYKREAFELFGQMLDSVKNEVTKVLMTVQIQSPEQIDAAAETLEQRADSITNMTYSAPTETGEVETIAAALTAAGAGQREAAPPGMPMQRVGRNEPCPCGSGKKFKHCHGKLT
ncbi:MAG: SEC-C metal-binding domain-containing protein, partial [Burkholderiales bacterium]